MEHFIKNIEITNFKSIRHAEIKGCRRVNVFVGPPNVGKSNILEALSFLSVGVNVHNVDLRKYLRFDKYANLFYDNNIDNQIEIKVDEIETLTFKYLRRYFHLRSESYKMFFEMEIPLDSYKSYSDDVSTASDSYDNLERLQIKKYIFSESDKFSPPNFSRELMVPFGENISDAIKYNRDLKKEVVELFKSFKLKYATDENNIRIIKEFDDQEVKIFPYIQIADTIRRLIFYKAAIMSNVNSLLLLEEPEAHCYEPYILEFTNSVKRDQNNNQFFIVTHSQYVIEELLRDEESRNDTNIYIVGLENNETKVKLLSQEMNKEIYQTGLNVFFNYQSLWNEMKEHEAVH